LHSVLFQSLSLIAHTRIFQSSFFSRVKGGRVGQHGVFSIPQDFGRGFTQKKFGFGITDFFKGQSRTETFTYNYTEMIFAFSLETFFCIFASCNGWCKSFLGTISFFFVAAKPPCTVNDFFDSQFFFHTFLGILCCLYISFD